MSIKERYMYTGESIEEGASGMFGQVITGGVAFGYEDEDTYIVQHRGDGDFDIIAVDPATIEPVAVKPIKSDSGRYYVCPNCEHFCDKDKNQRTQQPYEYCRLCGQRLDWSENE
ncbi:MAG: hypothetical protein LBL82_00295 [Oscillospiraceae bacterium]|jgi:uncharacterized protein YlaI|nr:hypothetical protein [Oscillospiraceae bacterium]